MGIGREGDRNRREGGGEAGQKWGGNWETRGQAEEMGWEMKQKGRLPRERKVGTMRKGTGSIREDRNPGKRIKTREKGRGTERKEDRIPEKNGICGRAGSEKNEKQFWKIA